MENCPVCRSTTYKTATIGRSNISGYVCSDREDALAQPIFDIQLNLCADCSTLFQKRYSNAESILNKMYTQHEATIRSSVHYSSYYDQFANNVAVSMTSSFCASAKILEIGCNNGLLLGLIGAKCKADLYGVEPSVKFQGEWGKRNITGTNDFFGSKTAKLMKQNYGVMNVVIARHVLEHIADPHDFFAGLQVISDHNTSIFIEVPYLTSIFLLHRFENVSYSHLVHYSVKSMLTLASIYGFLVVDYNLCDIDGGSIVFKLCPMGTKNTSSVQLPQIEAEIDSLFEKFIFEFEKSKNHLRKQLDEQKGEVFIGFGAGAKGQFLIHLYGLQDYLVAVIDETPGYPTKYIPGTSVPIVGLDYLDKIEAATVINLAPTHTQAVSNKIPSRFTFIDPVNETI